MADLNAVYSTCDNLSNAGKFSIVARIVTKTTHDASYVVVDHKAKPAVQQTLVIDMPEFFKQYEFIVATDSQGVVKRGNVNGATFSQLEVALKSDDKYAFINILCTHPEQREFTRFINIGKICESTPSDEDKYKGVVDLLKLVEKKLSTADNMSYKFRTP